MVIPDPPPKRRTQVERSAATVTKLLNATIDAIVELGYTGATTREICQRAGVSQGGLFRHFSTRRDLVVAAVERLSEVQLEQLTTLLRAHPESSRDDALARLRVVRSTMRQPSSLVLLEVVLTARTEPELVDSLRSVLVRQDEALLAAISTHPLFARLSDQSQRVWLDISRRMLEADSLWQAAAPDPDLDDTKLEALVDLLFLLEPSDRQPDST